MPSPSRPAPDDPPQSSFAEILPCADPNDAGTEWRATRLRDLAWRARCLGVHDAPEIQSALLAMREATAELDAMSIAQSSPSYHRPWWADGEYDEARAEVANDLGVASFRARDWSAAFDHHTEAIRLEPRRAVYHANRAAAALKLGRHRCALDDADAAVERDPTHVQALCAPAPPPPPSENQTSRSSDSKPSSRENPTIPSHSEATLAPSRISRKRTGDAPTLARRRGAAKDRRSPNPTIGRRSTAPPQTRWTPKPSSPPTRGTHQPPSPPQRRPSYADASNAPWRCARRRRRRTRSIKPTTPTRASTRERRRRGGRVWTASRARARLCARSRTGDAGAGSTPRKMIALGARLERLRELTALGDAAANDGRSEAAERAFDAALRLSVLRPPAAWTRAAPEGTEGAESADPGRVEGADRVRARIRARARDGEPYPNRARADLLRRRASARLDRVKYGAVDDAKDASRTRADVEADLDECIAIHPSDVDARRLRAEVRDARGNLEGAFADLRAAFEAAPWNAELDAATRDAARAALGRRREHASFPGTETGTGTGKAGGALYRALGVSGDADARGDRTGYRRRRRGGIRISGAGFGEAERRNAAAAFERVAEAYETLGDPARRRAYDADPRRRDEEDAARAR